MIYRKVAAATLLSLVLDVCASSTPGKKGMLKSIWNLKENGAVFDEAERRRLQKMGKSSGPQFASHERKLTFDGDQEKCDSSFLNCLPNDKCVDCFVTLQTEGIDWASVSPDTPCSDVITFLNKGGHCNELKGDSVATGVFCGTFDACVVWDDDDTAAAAGDDENFVNCTELTECDWPGIHFSFIGDGVCHNNIHGCYNTEVCGWDGGDCCEDTCDGDFSYVECGHDGYACRDPESENCDPTLTTKCANGAQNGGNVPDPSTVQCASDETKYRLIMYDSFGDGWDTTTLTLAPTDDLTRPKFKGSLADGSVGTEYVCLSKMSPTCYNIDVQGGTWGVEVSWEIKSMGEGTPAIAGGGAPMNCQFGIAGSQCENTCSGKPNVDPNSDPDYKSFKELYNCISDKCLIQLGACESDPICAECFEDDAPDYCFNIDTFNAVIDCTMCSCTDRKESAYCDDKSSPGAVAPPPPPPDTDSYKPEPCSPAETMKGSNAVIAFSKCTDLDQLGMMVTEFDNNNFGELDTFETCAHSFKDEPNHGGRSALGCMQILFNAMTNPTGGVEKKDAPVEAIAALADNLYHHAESFCDCAKRASEDCPLCPSFMSFKTLLYESLDACQSLDEIDCDAWNEFYVPCQNKLITQFSRVDFNDLNQCDYAKDGCGGAGPFPAFRRLDCASEIPGPAWDFYNDYSRKCLKGDHGIPPAPTGPTPVTPVAPPVTPPTPKVIPSDNNKPSNSDGASPTPKPYVPQDGPAKPYVPSDSKGSSGGSSGGKKKKKRHFFRNFFLLCLIAGGGYYYYKRQSDSFNFVRYRRVGRNFDFGGAFGGAGAGGAHSAGESEMYSNLNNSTTFEPPSLPPPPTAMGPMGMGTEMT